MMNDNEQHDTAASKAIAKAITSLAAKRGYPAELVFEGALRGACALMLARGASAEDVAKMLDDTAKHIRGAGQALAMPVGSACSCFEDHIGGQCGRLA